MHKRTPLLLLLLVASFNGFSQNARKDNRVSIGTIDSVHSKVLNEDRKVWVSVPESSKSSSKRYPVVYLLDGDAHFHSVTGLVQQLSSINGNTTLPEMIVVGIPNTERTRDLTPTHAMTGPDGKKLDFLTPSGGGDKFLEFVEKELIPHIEATYPVAPYRMLIGHSFGGLMVIHTMINHPGIFNSYISIDPSLWWDNGKLLKQATTEMAQKKFTGKTLFVGVANTMPAPMDTTHVIKDTTGTTGHIRAILQFTKMAQRNTGNGLRFKWHYYPSDDHSSVPLISEYDGFRFIFDFLAEPGLTNIETANAALFRSHYKKISEKMGYEILPPESLLNEYVSYLVQQKMYDKALEILNLNLENYPDSAATHEAAGDYYSKKSDNKKALEYYTRAQQLKDSAGLKKKIESLKGQKK